MFRQRDITGSAALFTTMKLLVRLSLALSIANFAVQSKTFSSRFTIFLDKSTFL